MRGLKKQMKASEYMPAKAVPISLNMITVLHAILDTPTGAKGFSEESRVMFKAVSSFGFYGMCRINEVLPLKWKDVSLRPYRTSVAAPHEVTEYGTYALFNRKTAVHWTNTRVTSHTLRRAGTQYRFRCAQPGRRWSLRMIKWRAGWSVSKSTETLVRYLLDVAIQSEESELADCLAPYKTYLIGCPSAPYEATKNTEEGPVLKRLCRLETLVLEMKAQIDELSSSNNIPPQDTCRSAPPEIAEEDPVRPPSQTMTPELPTVKDWRTFA
ncbi:hypothetical protein JG688_00009410 [Phytophthora aleatoria]|uniref:Uncharacterized protein n=1 Tax=Phytophthora aleatoria TaxID=2496075 RepID=A0A8J5MFF8_9STRA|nr:hypothetical protein JG688_00009410 [Phytophthora aleatoria]